MSLSATAGGGEETDEVYMLVLGLFVDLLTRKVEIIDSLIQSNLSEVDTAGCTGASTWRRQQL